MRMTTSNASAVQPNSRERGCEEINIALSYVLSQPSPVWTLIGPASIGEVRSCFETLRWPLSADELRRLNLEDERPAGR